MTDNIEIIQTIIIVINFKMESGIRMNIIIGGTDDNNATFMSFTNVLFQKYPDPALIGNFDDHIMTT